MTDFVIVPERAACADAIEALHADAFGPGRFARAAFRLREQGSHDRALSFVALGAGDALVGSVRLTPVRLTQSGHRGWLLGPLAVVPTQKNKGIGKALVRQAVQAAQARTDGAFVILVGDAPYYAPLGFERLPLRTVQLPGPVDPHRLLVNRLGHTRDEQQLDGLVYFDDPAGAG